MSRQIINETCALQIPDHFEILSGKDLDGISAQLLLTEGADCSVFFHENEPGIWRASMRSLHVTDVSSIAAKHEGGGHLRAAGFTIRTDIHTAIKDITDDIAQQLRRAHVI